MSERHDWCTCLPACQSLPALLGRALGQTPPGAHPRCPRNRCCSLTTLQRVLACRSSPPLWGHATTASATRCSSATGRGPTPTPTSRWGPLVQLPGSYWAVRVASFAAAHSEEALCSSATPRWSPRCQCRTSPASPGQALLHSRALQPGVLAGAGAERARGARGLHLQDRRGPAVLLPAARHRCGRRRGHDHLRLLPRGVQRAAARWVLRGAVLRGPALGRYKGRHACCPAAGRGMGRTPAAALRWTRCLHEFLRMSGRPPTMVSLAPLMPSRTLRPLYLQSLRRRSTS